MKSKPIIAASILSADFSRLGEEIKEAEKGGAEWIHVDVMDGHFVPNITMGPLVVDACRRATDLPLDVHLMIEEPEQYLLQFVDAGASSITVHVETCPHLHQTLGSIHDLGVTAGVALNPSTPISAISEVLDRIDLVLVMTVNPGFGGQKLIKSTLNKVRQARVLIDSQTRGDIRLEVDGGIDSTNILEAANAGADVFVTGTSIFKHPSGPSVGTQALRTLLEPELLEQS